VERRENWVEGLDDEPCEELREESRDGAWGCLAFDVLSVGAEVPEGAASSGAEGVVVVPLVAVPESVPDLGALDDGALVAGATVVVESVAGRVEEGASPSFASLPLPLPLQLALPVPARAASTVPARVAATVLAAVGSAAVGPSLPQSA
jgi:hypothetical protein